MTLLQEIKYQNGRWFDPSNRRFFGDRRYYAKTAKSGTVFLIQLTNNWSNMFGEPERFVYRIHQVSPAPAYKIGELLEETFKTMEQVNAWLKQN